LYFYLFNSFVQLKNMSFSSKSFVDVHTGQTVVAEWDLEHGHAAPSAFGLVRYHNKRPYALRHESPEAPRESALRDIPSDSEVLGKHAGRNALVQSALAKIENQLRNLRIPPTYPPNYANDRVIPVTETLRRAYRALYSAEIASGNMPDTDESDVYYWQVYTWRLRDILSRITTPLRLTMADVFYAERQVPDLGLNLAGDPHWVDGVMLDTPNAEPVILDKERPWLFRHSRRDRPATLRDNYSEVAAFPDPLHDFGVKIQKEPGLGVLGFRYACCHQVMGTPGCIIGYPEPFSHESRDRTYRWFGGYPPSDVTVEYRGVAFKDRAYYDELHEKIVKTLKPHVSELRNTGVHEGTSDTTLMDLAKVAEWMFQYNAPMSGSGAVRTFPRVHELPRRRAELVAYLRAHIKRHSPEKDITPRPVISVDPKYRLKDYVLGKSSIKPGGSKEFEDFIDWMRTQTSDANEKAVERFILALPTLEQVQLDVNRYREQFKSEVLRKPLKMWETIRLQNRAVFQAKLDETFKADAEKAKGWFRTDIITPEKNRDTYERLYRLYERVRTVEPMRTYLTTGKGLEAVQGVFYGDLEYAKSIEKRGAYGDYLVETFKVQDLLQKKNAPEALLVFNTIPKREYFIESYDPRRLKRLGTASTYHLQADLTSLRKETQRIRVDSPPAVMADVNRDLSVIVTSDLQEIEFPDKRELLALYRSLSPLRQPQTAFQKTAVTNLINVVGDFLRCRAEQQTGVETGPCLTIQDVKAAANTYEKAFKTLPTGRRGNVDRLIRDWAEKIFTIDDTKTFNKALRVLRNLVVYNQYSDNERGDMGLGWIKDRGLSARERETFDELAKWTGFYDETCVPRGTGEKHVDDYYTTEIVFNDARGSKVDNFDELDDFRVNVGSVAGCEMVYPDTDQGLWMAKIHLVTMINMYAELIKEGSADTYSLKIWSKFQLFRWYTVPEYIKTAKPMSDSDAKTVASSKLIYTRLGYFAERLPDDSRTIFNTLADYTGFRRPALKMGKQDLPSQYANVVRFSGEDVIRTMPAFTEYNEANIRKRFHEEGEFNPIYYPKTQEWVSIFKFHLGSLVAVYALLLEGKKDEANQEIINIEKKTEETYLPRT
jgi:hypothetical protein